MQDVREPTAGGLADEPMPDETGPAPDESAGTKAREWMGQLEKMIEEMATQAAPVARQIGAKAAELAAIAGEKAGPFAARAAEVTADVGQKLAERAHQVAADLRRETDGASAATGGDPATAVPGWNADAPTEAAGTTGAVAEAATGSHASETDENGSSPA